MNEKANDTIEISDEARLQLLKKNMFNARRDTLHVIRDYIKDINNLINDSGQIYEDNVPRKERVEELRLKISNSEYDFDNEMNLENISETLASFIL
jgi:hypothetical protein